MIVENRESIRACRLTTTDTHKSFGPRAGGSATGASWWRLGAVSQKMRIARPGRGKSSGARVVFLFSGENIPVFLLTVFSKKRESKSQHRGTSSTDRGRKRND